MRAKLEIVALVLGFIGLFGTVVVTSLPMWRVSAFIGANLIVMEELWEGLWMNCYSQADIRMQCKAYDSVLVLSPELQAARGLMCASVVLVTAALLVAGCATKRSNCCEDNARSKNITLALAGSLYLLSVLTTLVPVSWVALTVIRNFYTPGLPDPRKRELGAALFIGWATSGVLLVTGVILLFRFSKRRSKREERYADAYITAASSMHKEEGVRLERPASSFHERHEYV